MKKQTRKKLCYFIFLIFISFILLNCMEQLQLRDPEKKPFINPPEGYGIVRLRITDIVDNASARTLFPQKPVFSSYIISFIPQNNQKSKEDIVVDGNGIINDINLEAGEWQIIVYGRVFFEEKEEIVADGSETVTVIPNENINITITIRSISPNDENGKFEWSLIVPNNIDIDFWKLTLSEWGNETNRVINAYDEIVDPADGKNINGFKLCKNGYYILHVSLGEKKQQVFYSSIVHIRSHETTSFEREIKPDEFVPVIIIDGSVEITSFRINGINLQPSTIEFKEVWAYSNNEKINFAEINSSRNWQMRIVEPQNEIDLQFYVILSANGYLLEIKIDSIEQVYQDDIFINLKINNDLLDLRGVLNMYSSNNLSSSDWEIKAYYASSSVQIIPNEIIVTTNTTGQWKMLINAFDVPTEIYFSAEKFIDGKKYKRINLGKRSVTNTDAGTITLNAYFNFPLQVWIKGNIFSNENSRTMYSSNGIYHYTRNNTLTDSNPNYFNILANLSSTNITNPNWNQSSETLINYDYSKVIKDNIGLVLNNNNNAIAWNNYSANRAAGQDNVKITLDFTNDEYFDESAMPLIKVERIEEVFISEGTFTMGSPSSEIGRNGPSGKSSEVQHSVSLSSFYMMSTEVTQQMYEELMPVPAYKNTNENFLKNDYPVVNINWLDAVEFSNKLSEKDGLTKVYTITGTDDNRSVTSVNWNASGWRLPTEAEWEYAARAKSDAAFTMFYDEANNHLNQNGQTMNSNLANYNASSNTENEYTQGQTIYIGHIVEVKSYLPNNFGLYNMHGNVWEFCWDWYGDYIIPAPLDPDPKGPNSGTSNVSQPGPNNINYDASAANSQNKRIIRGGSYYTPARYLRSAHRGVISQTDKSYNDIGFRLVRNGSAFPQ